MNDFPQKIINKDGLLFFENGDEVQLWGHNFQSNLYWEYGFRMKHLGIPLDSETLKEMCDNGMESMKAMKSDLIRCHLTPSDFTDAEGNLSDNLWLDLFGYLISKARENNIYVAVSFLNHMDFTLIEDSFIAQYSREEWIFDPIAVKKSQNYIQQLINTVNPYTGIPYKEDLSIATWEIINEPEYMNWDKMEGNPVQKSLFENWAIENRAPYNDCYYENYQYEVVLDYLNGMAALLKAQGATQPVIWNCNWPRMIVGKERIFDAISDSNVDAISFCVYPGQDEVAVPFVENPEDMSKKNFLPFLKKCFEDYYYLGWIKSKRFEKKAKVVYEFETMYAAENAHLYPAMATLFRSLGVQMATVWTHTFDCYAEYQGGSHILNLKTTPQKAVAYILANFAFKATERFSSFDFSASDLNTFEGGCLSIEKNVCAGYYEGLYLNSGNTEEIDELHLGFIHEIIGFGSSQYVQYNGTGIYQIVISDNQLKVLIYPDSSFLKNPWEWNKSKDPVVLLDSDSSHFMEISLPGFESIEFQAKPGNHSITLNKKLAAA